MAKDLAECFANRGLLCNLGKLAVEVRSEVLAHFQGCRACQEWAAKHKLPWRVLLR